MLFTLGLGERVVAVSHECDYPDEVKSKPRATVSTIDSTASSLELDRTVQHKLSAGQPLYQIDLPLLESLDCDLLITQSQCDVCAIDQAEVIAALEKGGLADHISVMTLHPQSLEDVFDDLMRIGRRCGKEQYAELKVSEYRQRIANVQCKLSHLRDEDHPRTTIIEWIDPLMLAGNWIPELLRLAGGQGPIEEAAGKSVVATWDAVIAFAPEVMVLCPCGFDVPRICREAQQMKQWPSFTSLPAVGNQRSYAIDGNAYFNRSGPRLVESLEILAHLLHPQHIGPPIHLEQQAAWCQLSLENNANDPWDF